MKWNKILAMGITFILLPIVFGNNTRNIQDMTDVERSEATLLW